VTGVQPPLNARDKGRLRHRETVVDNRIAALALGAAAVVVEVEQVAGVAAAAAAVVVLVEAAAVVPGVAARRHDATT